MGSEIGTLHAFGFSSVMLAYIPGTCALGHVVLYVATAQSLEGNSCYGLSIGYIVTAASYLAGVVLEGGLAALVINHLNKEQNQGQGDS